MAVRGPGPAPADPSEFVQRRPAPALRPFVVDYSGYRDAGVTPALHRGLPSPWITLILTLDEPLTLLDVPGGSRRDFDALIGGLHTSPAFVQHDGRQSGIQVSMRPLGARALLDLPAGELTSLDLPATDVLGPRIEALRRRLQAATTWDQRFDLLDGALLARVGQSGSGRARPAPEVVHAWNLLMASRGRASVTEVAHEVGWSARRLRTQCQIEMGLSPKSLARVVRFDRARRLLPRRALTGPSLAELAVRCGYADQSHLTRDFHDLAGLSPMAWLRAESRFVQDLDLVGAEDRLHD